MMRILTANLTVARLWIKIPASISWNDFEVEGSASYMGRGGCDVNISTSKHAEAAGHLNKGRLAVLNWSGTGRNGT